MFTSALWPVAASAQLKINLSYLSVRTASDNGPEDGTFDADMPVGNIGNILDNGWINIRTALAYDLRSVPAGAHIESAWLTQWIGCLEGTHTVALHGFADDGKITNDDFAKEGFLAEVTLRPIRTETSFDVTPLITRMCEDRSSYGEFVFREVSPVQDNVLLGIMMDTAGGPTLRIFYTIPEPGAGRLAALAAVLVTCSCRKWQKRPITSAAEPRAR